jgi:hypothetical protein
MPTVDQTIERAISATQCAPSGVAEHVGARSAAVPTASLAGRNDEDVESCENCQRHRVGLGPWLWSQLVPTAMPDDAEAAPIRLTLCRDCLAFRFSEYFAD